MWYDYAKAIASHDSNVWTNKAAVAKRFSYFLFLSVSLLLAAMSLNQIQLAVIKLPTGRTATRS